MSQVDLVAQRLRRHCLVEQLQGFYAPRESGKIDRVSSTFVANREPDESGYQLQIVFDPMLYFLDHRVFVADLPGELFPLRARAFRHIDERYDAITFRTVVILDDPAIGFDQGGFRIRRPKVPRYSAPLLSAWLNVTC